MIVRLADAARFGASEIACYKYPLDTPEHIAAREAYCEAAADNARQIANLNEQLDQRPHCHAGRDGDCIWHHCPQNIPGNRKGHCPLDTLYPEED